MPYSPLDPATGYDPTRGGANVLGDLALAPLRGVEGALQNVYGFADWATGDALPDWEERVLGRSKTMAGGIVEGAARFMVGFAPGVGLAGRLGRFTGLSSRVAQAGRGTRVAARIGRDAFAGGVADFLVMDAHEGRLADLIQEMPALQNPVTAYLESDEDEGELEGRIKNVLEGALFGVALDGVIQSLRALKAGRKALARGASGDEVRKAIGEASNPQAVRDALKELEVAAAAPSEDAVKPGIGKAIDAYLARNKELGARVPGDLNFDRISADADVRLTGEAALSGETARVSRLTHQEATQRARDLVDELGAATGETLSAGARDTLATLPVEDLRRVIDLGNAHREQLAGYLQQHALLRQQVLDPGKGFTGNEADLADWVRRRQILVAKAQDVKDFQGTLAQGLGEQKIRPQGIGVTIPPAEMDDAAVRDLIESYGGREAIIKEMKREEMLSRLDPSGVTLEATPKDRLPMTPEFFINNILFGPQTHAVNNISAMLQSIFMPLEYALGNAVTGNRARASRELGELFAKIRHVPEAFRMARVAFSEDAPRLLPGSSVDDLRQTRRAISAAGQGRDPDSLAGAMLDHLGGFINLPGKALMAEDEFWKQINYRGHMDARISEVAFSRFSDPAERASFIARMRYASAHDGRLYTHETLRRQAIEAAQREGLQGAPADEFVAKFIADHWDDEIGQAAQDAAQRARLATFTQDLDKQAGSQGVTAALTGHSVRGTLNGLAVRLGDAAAAHPVLRFVVPFVRTPTNLLQFYLDRSFGVASDGIATLLRRVRGQAVTQEAAADLAGRFATGTAMTMTAALYASTKGDDGLPFLTGAGPDDPDERRAWEEQGWQPYSIRTGDGYVSYRRFDPFATFLGVVADVVQVGQQAELTGESPDWLANVTAAMVENLGSKTYMAGLASFLGVLSDPLRNTEQALEQLARGFAPGSAFTTQAINPYLSDDRYLLEVRGAHQAFVRALPGGNMLLEKRRNLFGEAVERPRGIGPDFLSPLAYTQVQDDVVSRELAQVGARFGPPREENGGIDWSQYRDRDGQSAYDRWQELHGEVRINGRTLRESLRQLIDSTSYRRLSPIGNDDLESPRLQALRRVVSRYRAVAKRQAMREYPTLLRDLQAIQHNRAALASGATTDQLVELLGR